MGRKSMSDIHGGTAYQRGAGRRATTAGVEGRVEGEGDSTADVSKDLQWTDAGISRNDQQEKPLTEKQSQALKQLKERVHDVIEASSFTDHDYIKWLKARRFDVNKSEHMLRESLRYRQLMGFDRMLEEYNPPPVISEYLSGGPCGLDKEGSPIVVELFGRLDMRGLMAACRKTDLIKTKIFGLEYIMRQAAEQGEKLGKRIDNIVVIFDMKGVTTKALWRPGLQMYMYLVQILEDNYPEMMKRMFVVNAPGYFNLFWHVCKPLVTEDMRKKIFVCGKNFSTVLLEHIDASQLPVFLGGTCTGANGDPACSDTICQGGDIPQELYMNKETLKQSMEYQQIPASKAWKHSVLVHQPGLILRWEFLTEGYDIDFKLVFSRAGSAEEVCEDSKPRDVLPLTRVQSHNYLEDGYIVCEHAGTYTLCFDNKRSWFTAKKLYYKTFIDKTLHG